MASREAQNPGPAQASMKLSLEVADELVETVIACTEEDGNGLEQIVEYARSEFKPAKEALLSSVEVEFQERIDRMARENKYRLVLRNGAVGVEYRPGEGQRIMTPPAYSWC